MGLRQACSAALARGPQVAGCGRVPHRQRGFTLVELLLVMVLVGVASAGVAWALRDTEHTRLQREGQRLVALLEAARAHSRSTGVPVYWRPLPDGFTFEGIAGSDPWPSTWQQVPRMQVQSFGPLVLGPEPVIGAQSVLLSLPESPRIRVRIATDGVRPFQVEGAP